MADRPTNPNELARHARQHVESLKAAGIEWLPKAAPRSSVNSEPRPSGSGRPLPDGRGSDSRGPEDISLFEERAPTVAAPPAEERRHELSVLAEQVRPCQRCAQLV